MNALVLLLLLVLNFGISYWNAYASGAYLTESKIIGGCTRFIVWCGLVMCVRFISGVFLKYFLFLTLWANFRKN